MKSKNYRLKRLGPIALGSCLVFLLWSGANSFAQQKNKQNRLNRKASIHITSDKMEVNSRKNLIVFIGDVKANQGNMHIKANRLEVYTLKAKRPGSKREPASKDDAGEVDRIVAIGNVMMDQAKRRFATAARLEYRDSTGIAVLTGSPRVWEGKNQLVGAKIELNLREDKTIVSWLTPTESQCHPFSFQRDPQP